MAVVALRHPFGARTKKKRCLIIEYAQMNGIVNPTDLPYL